MLSLILITSWADLKVGRVVVVVVVVVDDDDGMAAMSTAGYGALKISLA